MARPNTSPVMYELVHIDSGMRIREVVIDKV
jgi:hypothetical protein